MNCPICNVTLLMTDKHGVEIDYCPQCRGIWLDRGELEKIIGKVNQSDSKIELENRGDRRYNDHDDHSYHNDDHGYKYKRKKGLLGELFDF
jgi:uncharacterized protein